MALSSLICAVFLGSHFGSLATARLYARGALPVLPKADNATPYCSWWHDYDVARPYGELLQQNGITLDEFRRWNPTIGAAGEGLTVGRAYCVEAALEPPPSSPRPATPPAADVPPSSPKTPVDPVGEAPSGPSPSQPGRISTCTNFYKTVGGDTCYGIVQKYGTFTLDDFYKWNPAIGSDCRGLWTDVYVCVGVSGTPVSKPAPQGPSPTRPGMVETCDKYHFAKAGENCWDIAQKYRIELDDFFEWNPSVQRDCSGLWASYHYCVGVAAPFQFRVRATYHTDCTGNVHKEATVASGSDGLCLDTNCAVGSLDVAAAGTCPGGQVQISYWENPGCGGKWYGYGYATRGTCRKLWTEGWKFKAVHLRCAAEKDDCVSKRGCTYEPEPASSVC